MNQIFFFVLLIVGFVIIDVTTQMEGYTAKQREIRFLKNR